MNVDSVHPSPIPLEIWGATDKGRQREGNEDAIYPHSGAGTFPFQPDPTRLAYMGQVMLVADGVGGGGSGSEASRWVRRVAVERYYDFPPNGNPGYNLQQAVLQANAALYQYIQSTGARDAGSTIVAAVVYGDILYVAHVGDSRAYLFRNGQVDRITRDHTLAQQKYDMGQITLQQLETDPDRSVLTRSMGISPTVAVDLNHRRLSPGDVILLCSDGLTDVVWEEEIAHIVQKYPPRRAAQELIKLANRRGGPDNISVVIAQVGGRAAAPARARPTRRRAGAGLAALAGWQKGVLAALAVALLALGGLLGWAVL
ncbi:MAG: PP2C family protein-serine/threonine phosphatase, partial [Anaerolineae bacterium]